MSQNCFTCLSSNREQCFRDRLLTQYKEWRQRVQASSDGILTEEVYYLVVEGFAGTYICDTEVDWVCGAWSAVAYCTTALGRAHEISAPAKNFIASHS